ncbi:hypothetical protein ACFS2C_23815 [Prauserella oleivorans]|uniref:DUF3558 domain-containing protein n=1 Tax=Prauserella oleivorans TaxID=1478153 RepID=A0ABW5WJ42_9PSEU
MGKIVGRRSGVLLGIVLLGLLSGCAGEDLAKANFQRTTVSAEPGTGQGEVPEGPITDPAVSQSALRTVDPCGLLTDRIVGDLGSLADEPYRSDWGSCRVELRDAGDKTVDVGLELGETVIAEPTGGIEGLPLVESTLDDGTCFVTAVTGYEPTVGVTAQVEYPGGNACDAGYTLVGNVIRELRADPPRYETVPGSLVDVDPCTVVSRDALAEAFGPDVVHRPSGLHHCDFTQSGDPAASVRLYEGVLPEEGDNVTRVDLGNGVSAVQERITDAADCDVVWMHRPGEDGMGEVVGVNYRDYSDDATADGACAAAVTLAKGILGRLPSP